MVHGVCQVVRDAMAVAGALKQGEWGVTGFQLFFMAADGVTSRAKMNQQQIRGFLAKGEKPPDEKVFNNNCITSGISLF